MSLTQPLNQLSESYLAGVNVGIWWLSQAVAKGYNSF